MASCEPCGDNGQHKPECDISAALAERDLSRQLSADIHADRKRVMAERDTYRTALAELVRLQRSMPCLDPHDRSETTMAGLLIYSRKMETWTVEWNAAWAAAMALIPEEV